MSAVLAPEPVARAGARAQTSPAGWISRPQLGEVQVSCELVAAYTCVKPDAAGTAAPVLHLVLRLPQPEGQRNGARLHALLWLFKASSAEQASADAEAAKWRLLAHAHQNGGLVRLQGRDIKPRDGGLDLWLDSACLLHCALQPLPLQPAPRPLLGAWL
jgi:hypothetical protein